MRTHANPMNTRRLQSAMPAEALSLSRMHKARSTASLLALTTLCGCDRAPSFGIYGSYFPAWLLCLVVGIALTVVTRLLLRRSQKEEHLSPLGLIYPCLAITFTCLLWLALFL